MRIAVIDGQGGGIGKHITEKLRKSLPESAEIIALGTNAVATSAMLKAGANDGATGENAIVFMAERVDIIVGSICVLAVNSMLGELTPKMAEAIANSKARKLLLPINRNGIEIVGAVNEPLPHQIDKLVTAIKKIWRG
jgi:NAD(P)-dependent dehydrogenase (short-subunit alcohol dehydrogenase family)